MSQSRRIQQYFESPDNMASSLRHRVVAVENNNFEDTNNNTLPNVMNN